MSEAEKTSSMKKTGMIEFDPTNPGILVDTQRSISPRVKGGGFSKSCRFEPPPPSFSPGPVYKVPSLLETAHVHGPVYRPNISQSISRKPPSQVLRASPSRDRAAWLLGHNKEGLAVYKEVSDLNGPGHYTPKYGVDSREMSPPRPVFTRSGRFQLNTTRGGPGMDADRIGKDTPGPKYDTRNVSPTRHNAPAYSFRSSGRVSERSGFMQARVQQGYYYNTETPTTECVSLSRNDKDLTETLGSMTRAPRPVWSKNERFADSNAKQYISKKHCRSKLGMNSPGPAYFPHNHELGRFATKPAVAGPGKWVP